MRNARSSPSRMRRSEEHTSELQSRSDLVCRLLLEKKKKIDDRRPEHRLTPTTPTRGVNALGGQSERLRHTSQQPLQAYKLVACQYTISRAVSMRRRGAH